MEIDSTNTTNKTNKSSSKETSWAIEASWG